MELTTIVRSMIAKVRQLRAPVAVMLALALLVSACASGAEDDVSADSDATEDATAEDDSASGDSGSDDLASESDTEADEQAEETIPVTFQPATESMAVLTQLVAFAGGYFEEEGLDVTYNTVIPNAAQVAQSVSAGQADIAMPGSTGVATVVNADRDVVSVATITKAPTTQIVIRNDVAEGLGVSADDPVEDRVDALSGLTIGLPTPGSTTDIVARDTLSRYGLDPESDVTIRPINDPAALVTALREGQIDAMAFSPPTSVQGVAEGYAQVWVDLASGDVEAYAQMPYIEVVTSRAYLDENEEAVTRFVRAIKRAAQLLEDDPDAAAGLIKPEYFAEMDQALFDEAFKVTVGTATRGVEPSESGFETLVQLVNATAEEPVDIAFEDMYLPDFASGVSIE